jgi:hypothetical protein
MIKRMIKMQPMIIAPATMMNLPVVKKRKAAPYPDR